MPTFHIETTHGTFEVEANRAPSPEEVQQLVAGGLQPQEAAAPSQHGASGTWQDDPANSGILHKIVSGIKGAVGADSDSWGAPGLTPTMSPGTARVAIPAVASLGGPMVGVPAAAATEKLYQDQKASNGGGPSDSGEVNKATIMAMIPVLKAKGLLPIIKNALMQGGGAGIGEEVKSLINDGKLADSGRVGESAGLATAIAAGTPLISKGLGKLARIVNPDDAAAMAKMKADNAPADATMAAMKERVGIVTPPSATNNSKIIAAQESAAGQLNMENEASKRNAPKLMEIARTEASLPPGAKIDKETLKIARDGLKKPYQELQAITDKAKADLADLDKQQIAGAMDANDARVRQQDPAYVAQRTKLATMAEGDIRELMRARDQSRALKDAMIADPANNDIKDQWRAAKEGVAAMQAKVDAAATEAGKPELVDQMNAARVKLAKNHAVENAVGIGNGNIDASYLRRRQEAVGDLTGGLEDIAKFQQAYPDYVKNVAGMPTAPSAASSGAAVIGAASASNPATAAMAGGLPLMRGHIRDRLLSPEYQARNAGPRRYNPKTGDTPAMRATILAALENLGRTQNDR